MIEKKIKSPEEWFRQADYDLETAKALFDSGRYIYTIFMCHLSIEKALKGLLAQQFKKDPPKIHNLNYFCDKLKITINDDFQNFIDTLNTLSVPTRYPDTLERLLKDYKKEKTKKILEQTGKLLIWLKQQL